MPLLSLPLPLPLPLELAWPSRFWAWRRRQPLPRCACRLLRLTWLLVPLRADERVIAQKGPHVPRVVCWCERAMCTHGVSVGDARGKNGYEGEPLAAREGESTPVAGEGEGRAWRSPRRRLAARWPVGPAGCSAAGSGAAGARPRGATGAVEPPGRRREARRGPHSCGSGSPTPSRHCSHDLRCERAAPIVFGRAPRPSRLGCDSAAGCTCCAVIVVGTAAAVVVAPPAGHRQKSASSKFGLQHAGAGPGGGNNMQAEACCALGGERCREPLLL